MTENKIGYEGYVTKEIVGPNIELISKELDIKMVDWKAEADHRKDFLYNNKEDLKEVKKNGINCCMDGRELAGDDLDIEETANIIGGGAGFVGEFLARGKSLEEAINLTKKLYDEMGWGQIIIHDDEHFVKDKKTGCGFVDNLHLIIKIFRKVNNIDEPFENNLIGQDIFKGLKQQDARVVRVVGAHNEKDFVINEIPNTSFNRKELNDNHKPAFLFDLWKFTDEKVINFMKENVDPNLDKEKFSKDLVLLHFATLRVLGKELKGNVVHLQKTA